MITGDLHQRKQGDEDKGERITLSTLSDLTGFPLEFIKKELMIQEESLSMGELRESVLRYLSKSDEGYSGRN